VPLHQRLGERRAGRVNAGHAQSHVIGNIRELKIADFAVHDTPLVGRTIGELKLEEATGVHIVAVWKRGRLLSASPDIVLSRESVALVAGTADQMRADDSRRRNRAVFGFGSAVTGRPDPEGK
jgi:voltage-gated potassium channel